MKRMVTEEEIIDLIQKYAPGFDPSAVEEGDILKNAILGLDEGGDLVKGNLFGKYAQVIPAPASTTLSEAEENAITEGVFVNGTFLELKNPMFLPAGDNYDGKYGYIIVCEYRTPGTEAFSVYPYTIIKHVISKGSSPVFRIDGYGTGNTLFGKGVPAFPDSLKALAYNGTSFVWKDYAKPLYFHSIVFDVGLGQTFTIRLLSDSAETCAVDSVSGNFTIPNSTFIQPANMGNVVITPFNDNQFSPDIYAFDSTTGTFSNQISLASVTSDTVTPIV